MTRDFDFVVARPGASLGGLIDAVYDRGFELASRVDATGEVTATILRVASEADLLCLRKIAAASRSSPGDAEDIAFLEARRRAKRR